MGFDLTSNIDAFMGRFEAVASRQLPFALSRALNDTAEDVRKAEVATMRRVFDRPTPYTLNAFQIRPSTKASLSAVIETRPVQGPYLERQADGGIQLPKGRAVLLPVRVVRNAYGNLPVGAVKKLLGRSDVFVARQRNAKTAHLTPGIYQRGFGDSKKPILLIAFKDQIKNKPIYDFEGTARVTAEASFPDHFATRFAEAVNTAR